MINLIVVHCSATPPSMDIGAAEIRKWHTDKGWSDIGYHYVIKRDGDLEVGRDESRQGAHVRGHNKNSLGVCLIGGVDRKGRADANFTFDQYQSLGYLMMNLTDKHPKAEVKGHRDFSNKACPSFDVQSFMVSIK